jgi:predicted permease
MNEIEVTILSIILMIAIGYVLKRIDFLSEKDINPFLPIVMQLEKRGIRYAVF